ncbi:NAD(P)-binding oxidoreductase [Fructilactobacillus fructivorans]|uniref:NAD(P)-binding domain-containing protein n=1 Tax=Fructilactobacillus fructivorans TaxID=1614 RepID=A0A0C1PNT4_9LACO|nr:NAD(P)-binding oxidoreductase [Fructilactobacillus fructivorans]KID42417.1 hypothetical protein LfDm3_0346 [Fructilactobacillus fructivorans]MCT0150969.1 NAD(P)-dependent oxidoreductase [Fructilactobacillus fructivorans]MCT2867474.1 NAD(P)-dependent oxidoreductase [Fructilactobacillus fructivorans]MCT2869008.1 NAD(P)-dependent oxidoreductase [Fructilactobacillus fructivorans]MCT2873273.1 NAD(P)-dependent oxidoreductase [Fructilactobacillus fructivorans]
MKIMIIGGTGRVGSDLVKQFRKNTDDEITIAARHPEEIKIVDTVEERPKIKTLKFSIVDMTVEQMADTMKGFDAIYFTAGSGGHNVVLVDSYGAIKTMQAAEEAGVKRYIMLSSAFALQPAQWEGKKHYAKLQDYQAAKFMADHWLIHDTDLNYTILQPGSLLETPGTGEVTFNDDQPGSNSINDVSQVLFDVLDNKHAFDKVIIMHSGDMSIETALNNLK